MTTRLVLEFQHAPEAKDLDLLVGLAEKFNASVVEWPDVFKKKDRPQPPDFPGIEKTPGVCGGDARVAGTRIPVWSLVIWKNLGLSGEKLLAEFETLSPEGLSAAWNYYAAFKEEVDALVAENELV